MKFTVGFFWVVLLVAGCSKSDNSPGATPLQTQAPPGLSGDYPTLVVDEQHRVIGSNMPPAYEIVANAGIRLDASQFHFTYGSNPIIPNMVMVIGNRSGYRLSQPAETNTYVIDTTTLQPLKGGSFQGFRQGDELIIAIGRVVHGSDKDDFWASWVGRVDVK